jgi:hypothetical protein
MKKIVLFIMTTTYFFASVDINKEIIQIGVFKSENSIKKIKKSLKKYEIFIKKYPNKLKKVFIVNIKKDDYKNVIEEIKKISPKAFRLTSTKKAELLKNTTPKDWLNDTLSNNNQTNKLDSKAIIKTRKKFFE